MLSNRTNRVFTFGPISQIFQKKYDNIQNAIESESDNYILNVNETEYLDHLESSNKLVAPIIHFDDVYADSYEKDIPAEHFPRSFSVEPGKLYKREIIQYFIPCSGQTNLLKYGPSSVVYLGAGGFFEFRTESLVAEFVNFTNKPEEITSQYQTEVNGFHQKYNSLIADINVYNISLKNFILSKFTARKQNILSKKSLLSALGVPIRKKENTPTTFSIPKPVLREKVVIKPIVYEKSFKPEPTLDEDNYKKILKLINDVGKNFERMPSIYVGKKEEDLRDHILMTLDPNFELGNASGETFNKTGKTDIQLRYDSSVVFIAECKFWSGEKGYFSAIDQLLSYLTWRDTKTSVVLFVRQKEFLNILTKIKIETPSHLNYLGFVNMGDENWFNYRFHLPDDRNREIKIAVQLFHLPK